MKEQQRSKATTHKNDSLNIDEENSDSNSLDSKKQKDDKIWAKTIQELEQDAERDVIKHKKLGSEYQGFNELAENTYLKENKKVKIDLELYEKEKKHNDANNGMDFNHKPSKEKINILLSDFKHKNARKLSKMNKSKDRDSTSFINDKNRQFNEKLNRHYGEFTKEIKESFERGSA
ncbi:hypothetical protein PACTADRAFT_50787, partial [Pachysolen tannophilus NRRL Y-2460]